MKKKTLLSHIMGVVIVLTSLNADAAITKSSALERAKNTIIPKAKAIDPKVLEIGLKAYNCALKMGKTAKKEMLTIIDFSRPSSERRFWIYDVKNKKLLSSQLVAHGQGSGSLVPTHFSNKEGSHQSSIGVFVTANTYEGKNGLSLRLNGLERGINDNASDRAIVIHGASYVNESYISKYGQIGRSWGCPALDSKHAQSTIDTIKDGSLVVAYNGDNNWIKNSEYLHC